MSDMICLKSLRRCQTPGMCSTHGGCHKPTFQPDWNQLEATQESLREHMQIIAQLKTENESLRGALTASRDFVMHEAEVRGFLDEHEKVSHRHPKRKALIDSIDVAMSKGEQQ